MNISFFPPFCAGPKAASKGGFKAPLRSPQRQHQAPHLKRKFLAVKKILKRITLRNLNSRFFFTVFSVLLFLVGLETTYARAWTSTDGRTLNAKGLYWLVDRVILEREDNGKVIPLLYEALSYDDQVYAITHLPHHVNEDIKIKALTVSTGGSKLQIETGKYALYANFYSYDGYNFIGEGTIKPITKKVRYSGKTVKVDLSSFFGGDGVAGVEFYALKGGAEKSKPYVYHSEVGVIPYSQHGTSQYFSTPKTPDFKGWVVLVRSPNTGKIIQIESSLKHLEKYVVDKVPEVAKFKINIADIKKSVLEELKKVNTNYQKKND